MVRFDRGNSNRNLIIFFLVGWIFVSVALLLVNFFNKEEMSLEVIFLGGAMVSLFIAIKNYFIDDKEDCEHSEGA
jgi:hypothetical protein